MGNVSLGGENLSKLGKIFTLLNKPRLFAFLLLFIFCFLLCTPSVFSDELSVEELIDEALRNNPDILTAQAKWKTSTFRIPQVKSLPDPMFMLGYQNEGWRKYSFGEMEGAQWISSASQIFPFPGKLSLKGEMAERDSEVLRHGIDSVRLNVIKRVKELFYDLYLTHKELDLVRERAKLFKRIEDVALARYSSGIAPQQEVLMAQTEKYMLLEREEMLKGKMQSIEAMLNTTIGRDVNSPLGRPSEPSRREFEYSIDELIRLAYEASPYVKSKEEMVSTGKLRIVMAEKEYYPDLTLTGTVIKRAREFEDMWSLTMAVNIPLFYKTKQRQALNEARSFLSEAEYELEATKITLSAEIRNNYSIFKTAEKLMELYKSGLIQKTYQDFELGLSGYVTGKVEAITVISRLKALIDYETQYWRQFVEREKAIARIEALTGIRGE